LGNATDTTYQFELPSTDWNLTSNIATTGNIQGAGLALNYRNVTSSVTVGLYDHTVNCTGTLTVTLPTAVGNTGRVYVIKNTGNGLVTVATTSAQTIDGILTQLLNKWEALQVQSDGTNYIII